MSNEKRNNTPVSSMAKQPKRQGRVVRFHDHSSGEPNHHFNQIMGLYDEPSPRLTLHLRYIHKDMDPTSSAYLSHFQHENDTPDPDGRFQLGAQRTPLGKMARRDFLWSPLPTDGWEYEGADDIHTLILDMTECTRERIERTEEVMREAGRNLDSIMTAGSIARDVTGRQIGENDFYGSPLYQQCGAVYFNLACRIPYLHQVQALVAACNLPYIDEREDASAVHKALIGLKWDLMNRPCMALRDAVNAARLFKSRADKAMQLTLVPLAVAMYVRAIKQLLPWFPSPHYMAPWEARTNGVGSLLVQCNLNLALAMIHKDLAMHKTAFMILTAASSLHCVSNWEKAKLLHWQGRCAEHSLLSGFVDDCEWELNADHSDKNFLSYDLQRNLYLDKPPHKIAEPTHAIDFSPQSFRDHYQALCSRLGPIDREPWWELEDSTESDNMDEWLQLLLRLRKESLTKGKPGVVSCQDLEDDNASWDARGERRWEYAL